MKLIEEFKKEDSFGKAMFLFVLFLLIGVCGWFLMFLLGIVKLSLIWYVLFLIAFVLSMNFITDHQNNNQ